MGSELLSISMSMNTMTSSSQMSLKQRSTSAHCRGVCIGSAQIIELNRIASLSLSLSLSLSINPMCH